ncbi:DUF4405 domain-containing protein [Desulfovibrio sp.]|uniref:DUF4405 domain-containing protein n=1 Tax=Desulfovibrio sp. TaxID=885 RepID=UPI0025B991AC|nr:DUF4405 domain-containing protein [Desulfovibrio sp.]
MITSTSRLWLALAMTLLYVAALGCRLTGAVAHEWIGVAFCALCVLHLVINRRWFKGITRGKYTFRRHVNLLLNMLLMLSAITLCVTGVLGSRHIFGSLGFEGGMGIRQLHTFAAYWGMVLLGVHTGLQWLRVLTGLRAIQPIKNLLASSGVRLCLAFLLSTYGVWASFDRAMGSKLFLGFSFDFWDTARPELLFYAHNLAILALYAVITHYLFKLIAKIAVAPRGAAATEIIRP